MHTPTEEQQAILDNFNSTKDNLLVTALAGAAKTSTLELIASQAKQPMLCLAFNKAIATEMQARLPPLATCKTLNALGHRAWMDFIKKKNLKLDAQKRPTILRNLIKARPQEEQENLWEGYRDMVQAVSDLANWGYVPPWRGTYPLVSRDDAITGFTVEFSQTEIELIFKTAEEAARMALNGEIDFADQILMPTVYHAAFPKFAIVLVDEAQDLSLLNHQMLELVAGKKSRVIAVGDPKQAIYAFRGAHAKSMHRLRKRFNMKEFPLTISFRCAQNITKHVHWHAPNMRWPLWAEDGEVVVKGSWAIDELPDDAVILCRNNAPIMGLALRLLMSGRRPELKGNDLARGLIKDMQKLSGGKKTDPHMPKEAVLRALEKWRADMEKRHKGAKHVEDKYLCMKLFIEQQPTLGAAVTQAENLFNERGPIKLMTVHKSKGLEWDEVHILDEGYMQWDEEEGQDLNLRYVACTRAKKRLIYIYSQEMEEAV